MTNIDFIKEENHEKYVSENLKLQKLANSIKDPEQKILSEKEYHKYLTTPIYKLETPIYQQVMLRRINELRKNEKLPPLKFDQKLTEVANSFSEELSKKDWINDKNPHKDEKGRYITGRLIDAGLKNYIIKEYNEDGRLVSLGENIVSGGHLSVDQILSMVMNSPGHKRALMSLTDIVGFSHTNPVVQVFAKKNPNYQEPQQPINDTITTPINDTIKKSDQ